jgi:glycogen debranching enzyme
VNTLFASLFDAARRFPALRLPELFGGQARHASPAPVPYPVACRPQAWTAGALLHLLQAVLGLVPDAGRDRLYVIQPKLPSWLHEVHLERVPVGKGHADLHFTKHGNDTAVAVETHGAVDVLMRSTWPR